MTRKEKKESKRVSRIRKNINFFLNVQSFNIEKSIESGRVTIRDHINSIETLFANSKGLNNQRKKLFHIGISWVKYKEFKNASKNGKYSRNKELKAALKEMRIIRQRQYFRNSEAFRLMLEEIKNYKKRLSSHSSLKKLCREKGEIGEISKTYRKKQKDYINKLKKEIKITNKQIKKSIIINDIERYLNFFIDFFIQEEERLIIFKDEILGKLNVFENAIDKYIDISSDELKLELPSWNFMLEAE